MSEVTQKKRKYSQYNTEVINALLVKYGLSQRFIHQSLSGERTSPTSLKIVDDYKKIHAELKKTMAAIIDK